MTSKHPFTSQEPRIGEPSLGWDDFRRPRLRRFPESFENLELGRYLGTGVDGFVFKARIRGQTEPLAVKIFHFNDHPKPIRYGHLNTPGSERYWAFERECINGAILDMIAASLRRAVAADRQIFVHPEPKTWSQARNNLRAFSDEAVTRPQPEDFVPMVRNTEITDCFGWVELKGSDINAHFLRARVSDQESRVDDETYPAIVYQFVDNEIVPEVDTIVSQLNYFHITGFVSVSFNGTNWLGKGVLVDFSDIVSTHASEWWDSSYYALEQEWFRRIVQRATDKGQLGPPPKFTTKPQRLPAHFGRCVSEGKRVRVPLPPPPPPPEQGFKAGLS